MGNAYILWVYEDAVRHPPSEPYTKLKWHRAIGEAVIELCRPRMGRRNPDICSVPLANHSNALNLAGQGEVHSTWEQVYFWSGNCLRPLYELDDADLQAIKRLIDEKLDERSTRPA
jgi:hypothetical protein